jgi:putative ABC transport system permease protein
VTFLNLKLRRDIFKNWTQFFSVFLMSFLSVLVFVGLQGAWGGLEKSLDTFTKGANLADSWVYSTGFTKEDTEKIRAVSGVKKVVEKTRIQVTDERDDKQEKYLSLDTYSKANLSTPFVTEGKALPSDGDEGVWINKEYASENDIAVGDIIELTFRKQKSSLEVKGLIQSPERIYYTGTQEFIAPNYSNYGYGVITTKALQEKFHYKELPNVVEMTSADNDLRKDVEDVLGKRFIAYYNQETLNEVANALDRVGQIRNLSYMFSFLFILLAILAMYTTIRRLIESQTKEIAVLKALGFSNKSIGFHYASFGLLIGGGGALLGALVSPLLSWFVLSTQKDMFSIPEWTISYNYTSLVVGLLVISTCVLSAFLASREARLGLPVLFLRGGGTKKIHAIMLEKFPLLWERFSFENRWALRDGSINKVRMLMGIIGVAGGMMLLTAGFGMPESINHLVDKAYNEDFTYDRRLDATNFEALKKEVDGQSVQLLPARFTPDDGYNRLLIIIDEGSFVNMKTQDGKEVSEDGIYLTNGFADKANLKIGDDIRVRPSLDDKAYEFEIKGIIISETNQGAYVMQRTWENAGGVFSPHTLLVGADQTVENSATVDSVIKIADQKDNAYEFVASLTSIFMMIIAFAILLVIVVLYNLGTLNFVERTRDYATLRVLGFHKKELKKITMIENLLTTTVGWLLGIPLGLWFLDQYVKTFSTIHLEYTSYISIPNLFLASLMVWLCSLTTTFFIGRRIQKLDMVESLKSVD